MEKHMQAHHTAKKSLCKYLLLICLAGCLCAMLFGCSEKPVFAVLHGSDADYSLRLQADRSYRVLKYRITNIENVRSETLTIPSHYRGVPIASIAPGALERCALVKEIVLSDTLTEMDYLSIQECENIESIHIGAGMTEFNRGYIMGCAKLQTITVSAENPVLYVEDNCLIGREDHVLYAAAPTERIPDGVTVIAFSAFEYLPIASIYIPESVVEIGSHAFTGTSLTEIMLPDTLKIIGDYAFADTSIRELVVPDSVEEVGEWAFSWMRQLEKVTIGAGVTNLLPRCFAKDRTLALVEVSEKNPKYYTEQNCLIEKETGRVIFCGNQLTIPDSVRILGKGCISEETADEVEKVQIPPGVTTIEKEAFCGSTGNVKTIYIPETVTIVEEYAIVFGVGDSHTVYCEAPEKPDGWDEKWVEGVGGFDVQWGKSEFFSPQLPDPEKYYSLACIDGTYVYTLLDADGNTAIRRAVWKGGAPQFTMRTASLLEIRETDGQGNARISFYDGVTQELSEGKRTPCYWLRDRVAACPLNDGFSGALCVNLFQVFDAARMKVEVVPADGSVISADVVESISYVDDTHIRICYRRDGATQTVDAETSAPISSLSVPFSPGVLTHEDELGRRYWTTADEWRNTLELLRADGTTAVYISSDVREPGTTRLSDDLVQIYMPMGTGFWDMLYYDRNTQMLSAEWIDRAFYLQGDTMVYFRYADDTENPGLMLYVANVFYPICERVSCPIETTFVDSIGAINAMTVVDDTHLRIVYGTDTGERSLDIELPIPISAISDRTAGDRGFFAYLW